MIDSSVLNAYQATQNPAHASAPGVKPRLHMRTDPDARTAGSMPVWENSRQTPETAQSFDTAMNSYAGMEPGAGERMADAAEDESFGFGDLIDIVNPLHHIPLVSTVYESVTGDTIKPSGRIIGGAIFGGFAGAAAGIVNAIVEEETGKDMTGNVVALVTQGELPQARRENLSPEDHLNQAARIAFSDGIEAETLPPMAFGLQSQQPATVTVNREREAAAEYERYVFDEERTAGLNRHKSQAASTTHNSPLPRAMLADPVSINLEALRSSQMAAVTELKLSPIGNE